MTVITLSRDQIIKLYDICCHFADADKFVLEVDGSNGIGNAICVKVGLYSADITDVKEW